jgi:GNAT superfamily N-acetyltransferase
LEEGDAELFVGTFDDVSCGFAAVRAGRITVPPAPGLQRPDPPAGATLCWFYVEPEFRGVGVGEALLAAVEAWCADNGRALDVAVLPGAQDAKSLLEQLGFTARLLVMGRSQQ